jgi:NAD(P)-dependent dehydrogenase (short-subunit alcohol dehydrogenase family)
MSTAKTAIVTGANRGIGLEVCRQLAKQGVQVVLTARNAEEGRAAVESLARSGLPIEYHRLDVSDESTILALRDHIEKKFGKLDILVNNAGVFLDSGWSSGGSASALEAKLDVVRKTMETNVYGPFRLIQALAPLLTRAGHGRIVNVSSGMGQLSEMEGGYPGYRISKTALNAVTRIFSQELASSGVAVNSVCPGWVRTDMGGKEAPRTPAEGADTITWLAMHPDDAKTGGFYRDREPIDW